MSPRRRYALIALACSILAGAIAAVTAIGGIARLPTVLVLYFTGFAGGASLTSFIWRRH